MKPYFFYVFIFFIFFSCNQSDKTVDNINEINNYDTIDGKLVFQIPDGFEKLIRQNEDSNLKTGYSNSNKNEFLFIKSFAGYNKEDLNIYLLSSINNLHALNPLNNRLLKIKVNKDNFCLVSSFPINKELDSILIESDNFYFIDNNMYRIRYGFELSKEEIRDYEVEQSYVNKAFNYVSRVSVVQPH